MKRFRDHSARWQREALRDGLTATRWDAWHKLSAKTRKATDLREYAQGVSVATQRRSRLEASALRRLTGLGEARRATVERNVKRMTQGQLRYVVKASDAALRNRASADERFYYH